jgi:Flp pilus assembly pilin Flp
MVLKAANPDTPSGTASHTLDQQRPSCGKETAMKWVISLLREEEAATAVEYAVMLALILAAIIASIVTVGQGTGGMFSGNNAAFQAVGFGS